MTVGTPIDPGTSLGALVAERPARAELFERLRLEYCCGGDRSLAEACAARGLDLAAVSDMLAASGWEARQAGTVEDTDWRTVGAGALCAHLVTVHHDGLRQTFPRLERLLSTLVRVHADREPRLRDVERLVREIRDELEPHLAGEENELFPACIAAERTGTRVAERLLCEHESEHVRLGHALVALRVLCGGYDSGAALCETHRALLAELEDFERDLHRHVHEENNILLPRARAPRGPGGDPPAGAPAPARTGVADHADTLTR
jgi:regulator of cell morphogenesis and NO signaling